MIADNGSGFEAGKVQYGIGIQSILKRVKDMDGNADITSSPAGTIVNGYFPVG